MGVGGRASVPTTAAAPEPLVPAARTRFGAAVLRTAFDAPFDAPAGFGFGAFSGAGLAAGLGAGVGRDLVATTGRV